MEQRASAGEYLIAGGYVLSMDSAIGDLARGDVHIRDGAIVAVGSDIQAPGAELIDASNCVVLPGFVDTHWHMWNSLWRGLSDDAVGYFALHRLAHAYTADDHYVAVRYAATEALSAGFTTCHNWANGVRDEADAQAEMGALVDAGIRGHFGYGDGPPGAERVVSRAEFESALDWCAASGKGRLSLGAVIQNPAGFEPTVRLARDLGLATIAPHADFSGHLDLLGPDVVYTHGAGVPPELIGLLAARGVKVGLCPWTDPLVGAGLSPVAELMSGGVSFGDIAMSVDVSCQTAADPFSSMRMLLYATRIAQRPGMSFLDVLAQDAFGDGPPSPLMHPREALAIATINGARVLGLDSLIGSLTPGKRADVITVRTDDLNMMALRPESDAAALVVQCGLPTNVDTVLVDGRLVKQNKKLVAVDTGDVVGRAAAAQARLLDRTR